MPTARKPKPGRAASPKADAFMRALMDEIVRASASEARIEPLARGARARLRIDGFLHEYPEPLGPETHQGVLTKLKRLAKLPPEGSLAIQEGTLEFPSGENVLEIRLRIIPVVSGEKAILRMP